MDTVEQQIEKLRSLIRRSADPIDDPQTIAKLRDMLTHMREDGNRRADPMREIMARVGDKWSPLLMLLLQIRGFRHATLRRLVAAVAADGKISQRVLRLRMRTLERDGLVRRIIVDDHLPGVYYELTQMGSELTLHIAQLLQWTRGFIPQIRASQKRFDLK